MSRAIWSINLFWIWTKIGCAKSSIKRLKTIKKINKQIKFNKNFSNSVRGRDNSMRIRKFII